MGGIDPVGTFDPQLLGLDRGVSVSSVIPGLDPGVGAVTGARWFEIGAGWYAIANSIFGTEEDPGVIAFVWVRRPEVVDLVLHRTKLTSTAEAEFAEPDVSLVGFWPLTFGTALKHEKAQGRRPLHTAAYRVTDGEFLYSELGTDRRQYVFTAANPADDDKAIAVTFRLSAGSR